MAREEEGTGWRRRVRRYSLLLLVPLGLAAAWLLLVPLFLGWGLAPLVNVLSDRVHMELEGARMLVPGRFHVRGLRLRGRSPRFQWWVSLQEGRGNLVLGGLTGRVFQVDGLRGRGLKVHVRRTLEPGETQDPAVAPIPGLTNPPSEPLPPREGRNPWTFRFEDVRVGEVTEVWIEEYRFRGLGTAVGDLEIVPRQRVALAGTQVEVAEGRLDRGERPVFPELEGGLTWSGFDLDPRSADPEALFGQGDLVLEVQGTTEDLRFLDAWLEGLPQVDLAGGGGGLEADLRLRDGVFLQGSRLEAGVEDLRFRYLNQEALGQAALLWQVRSVGEEAREETGSGEEGEESAEAANPSGASQVLLEVDYDDFALRHVAAAEPHARGRALKVEVSSEDPAVLDGVEDLVLQVTVEEATVADFSRYNVYLPEGAPFRWSGGQARLGLRIRASRHTGGGEIRLRGEDLRARWEDVDLRGDLEVDTEIRDLSLEELRLSLDGTRVRIRNGGVVEEGRVESEGWWADIEASRARLGLAADRPDAPPDLEVLARARLRDTEPLVRLWARENRLVKVFQGLFKVRGVEASARYSQREGFQRITEAEITGKGLEARGCLRLEAEDQDGAFFARRGFVKAALEIRDGHRDLKVLRPREWFADQEICTALEAGRPVAAAQDPGPGL